MPTPLEPLGYLKVTTLGTAKGITPVPAGAKYALITTESQPIRWRDDGTSPTSSEGVKLLADCPMWYTGSLSEFKAIEITASATMYVSFYA